MNLNSFATKGVLVVFAMFFFPLLVDAQTSKKQQDQSEPDEMAKLKAQSQAMALPALDAPVDPERYVVGPSDQFAVVISYSPSVIFSLTVSLEGSLIVPTVGEVHVSDLTLSEARKKVLSEIRKKYITGSPSVTLLKPREILVNVSGTVKQQGTFSVYATDRVEKVLQDANRKMVATGDLFRPTLDVVEWPEDASVRNIIVRRRDGTVIRADLQKYHATKDEQWNPYLREGDEVFVPSKDLARNIVGVYGGINRPGRYEFVEGDRLADLIQLAQGLSQRAFPDSILLIRQVATSLTLHNSVFRYGGTGAPGNSNPRLEPGDRIVVREKLDQREDHRVTVEGEVLNPGVYPITRDQTRLSEVMQETGGLTKFASLKNAVLMRKPIDPKNTELERMIRNRGNISSEDEGYLNLENELRMQGERVKVDFEKLLIEKDSTQDVFLRPEDRIVIPSAQKSIYIFGQVVSPTQVPHVPGKDVGYYVLKAGGFTDYARSGDVMVIKHTTRQWLKPGETQIEDGDYIWVPKVSDRPFSYYLGVVSQTASIITGALTIVLLILQLK